MAVGLYPNVVGHFGLIEEATTEIAVSGVTVVALMTLYRWSQG